MYSSDKPPLADAYFAHVGVKGMKWGKRKDKSRFSPETKKRAIMVGIGVGVLTLAVGSTFVARRLRERTTMSILKDLTPSYAESMVLKNKSYADTKILHASSGGYKTQFRILRTGGYPSPVKEYVSAFGNFEMKPGVKKISGGRIAASFVDPEGRKDFKGRDIMQQVIVPKSMSAGIKTEDDVVKKVWPQLKDAYSDFYPD